MCLRDSISCVSFTISTTCGLMALIRLASAVLNLRATGDVTWGVVVHQNEA